MELRTNAPMPAYLEPATLIDRDHPEIAAFVEERLRDCSPEEAARRVFHFVRDDVSHSWDIQGRALSRSASDALRIREGICYPKSHLIAALLRRAGIPTAICYQRLTLDDNDESKGWSVHALNAVYINGRWSRIDARGNKPGVDAQFSLDEERLAFPVRAHYDEIDYPVLFAEPHPAIVHTLTSNDDALEMYQNRLPDRLDDVL
jgi:transglutaminase-like putative cysteine protease